MSEGYPPPDYIVNNWTDELFNLMVEKMEERRERENRTINADRTGDVKVSEELLFSKGSNLIEVKRGD